VVAGGEGKRLEGEFPKQFLDLGGRPLLAWSVEAFAGHPEVDLVIVALPEKYAESPPPWLSDIALVVSGGPTRAESVQAGLAVVSSDCQLTLVHDGARPFVMADLISRVIEAARSTPAIPVLPVTDTIKRVCDQGWILDTPRRSTLRRAQTPQGFPANVLSGAYEGWQDFADLTDDAALCEQAGIRIRTVMGDPYNFKVTTKDDLARARWLVESGQIINGN
jgi:2-C-methyl-D-erythritol 4-phosphate cytidylyltransferase